MATLVVLKYYFLLLLLLLYIFNSFLSYIIIRKYENVYDNSTIYVWMLSAKFKDKSIIISNYFHVKIIINLVMYIFEKIKRSFKHKIGIKIKITPLDEIYSFYLINTANLVLAAFQIVDEPLQLRGLYFMCLLQQKL